MKETKPIFVRVELDVKKKVEDMAKYKGLSTSSLVRSYIVKELREDERNKKNNN